MTFTNYIGVTRQQKPHAQKLFSLKHSHALQTSMELSPLITEILLHQHLSAVGGRRDEAVSTSHTATSLSLIQPFPGRLETGAVGGKLQQALSHAALLPI